MALFSERSWDDWLKEYADSHQHPVNRGLHTVGIPMIVGSIITLPLALLWPFVWKLALLMFVLGWSAQFLGHIFEKKPPEFLKDWRFLFVGFRWWCAKMRGRA